MIHSPQATPNNVCCWLRRTNMYYVWYVCNFKCGLGALNFSCTSWMQSISGNKRKMRERKREKTSSAEVQTNNVWLWVPYAIHACHFQTSIGLPVTFINIDWDRNACGVCNYVNIQTSAVMTKFFLYFSSSIVILWSKAVKINEKIMQIEKLERFFECFQL